MINKVLARLNKIKLLGAFIRGYYWGKIGSKLSAVQLHKHQQKLFARLKHKVLSQAPFYQEFLDQPLDNFPIINKSIFRKHFAEINTLGLSLQDCEQLALEAEASRDFSKNINGISVGLSSGTSGQRGVFLTSDREQIEWAAYIIARYLPFQLRRQKVALLLRSNNVLYEASQGLLLQFRYVDLTMPLLDVGRELEHYQPDILVGPALVLAEIANANIAISPIRIISGAEVLETDMKKAIEAKYAVPVQEIYQCTEGFIASSCHLGHLHLNEDTMLIEKHWIDKESRRFSPIVTDLRRSSLPIVRFALDDILIESQQACACGSQLTPIEKVEGRQDDILWVKVDEKYQALYPDIVRQAMLKVEGLADYRISQTLDHWLVEYESARDATIEEEIEKAICAMLHKWAAEIPEISFEPSITRSRMQKNRRIACLQKPK